MYVIFKTTLPRRKPMVGLRRPGDTRAAHPRLRVFVGVDRDRHRYVASVPRPLVERTANELMTRCEAKLGCMLDITEDERRTFLAYLTLKLLTVLDEDAKLMARPRPW